MWLILIAVTASLVWLMVKLRPTCKHHTALVLVIGDVGRSPRIMYHAQSLAQLGWTTTVVGYRGQSAIQSRETVIVGNSD